MSDHVSELISDFALDTLSEDQRSRFTAHIADCDQCAMELATTQKALTAMAAPLAASAPSPKLRDRLIEAIALGSRFDDFADRVAALFDLPVDKAKRYLDRIDDPSRWIEGPGPGVLMLPIRPGPTFTGSMSGFVKVHTGKEFPHHTHVGEEQSIVLQGACVDPDGTVYRRHQDIMYSPGSSHSFTVIEDLDFIAAVRLAGGFQLS